MVKDCIIQKNDLKILVHKVRYAGKDMRYTTNRIEKAYKVQQNKPIL